MFTFKASVLLPFATQGGDVTTDTLTSAPHPPYPHLPSSFSSPPNQSHFTPTATIHTHAPTLRIALSTHHQLHSSSPTMSPTTHSSAKTPNTFSGAPTPTSKTFTASPSTGPPSRLDVDIMKRVKLLLDILSFKAQNKDYREISRLVDSYIVKRQGRAPVGSPSRDSSNRSGPRTYSSASSIATLMPTAIATTTAAFPSTSSSHSYSAYKRSVGDARARSTASEYRK